MPYITGSGNGYIHNLLKCVPTALLRKIIIIKDMAESQFIPQERKYLNSVRNIAYNRCKFVISRSK